MLSLIKRSKTVNLAMKAMLVYLYNKLKIDLCAHLNLMTPIFFLRQETPIQI